MTSPRRHSNTTKLDRTLRELETALTDWEHLGGDTSEQAVVDSAPENTRSSENRDKEFRKRTKKLLDQLRQQLADLNE